MFLTEVLKTQKIKQKDKITHHLEIITLFPTFYDDKFQTY
jgi:hypothetical protein